MNVCTGFASVQDSVDPGTVFVATRTWVGVDIELASVWESVDLDKVFVDADVMVAVDMGFACACESVALDGFVGLGVLISANTDCVGVRTGLDIAPVDV